MKLRHDLKRLSYFFSGRLYFLRLLPFKFFYFMSSHVCGRLGVKVIFFASYMFDF